MHGFVLLARTVYTVRPSLVGTGTVHTYSRVGLVRSTYRSAGTVRSTGRRTAERKEPDRRSISSVPPPFFLKCTRAAAAAAAVCTWYRTVARFKIRAGGES